MCKFVDWASLDWASIQTWPSPFLGQNLPHLAPIHKFHLPQVTVLPIGTHLEKYYTHIKKSRNGNQRKKFPNFLTKIPQILSLNNCWRPINFPQLIPQTTAPKNMSSITLCLLAASVVQNPQK